MHNDDEMIINDNLVSEIGEEQLTSGQSFFQQGGFKNSAFGFGILTTTANGFMEMS